MMSRSRSQKGMTLIELMVVVVVGAILLALAAPPFGRLIEMQRLRGTNDSLVTDLQFARSEAIRLGVPVRFAFQNQDAVHGACWIVFSDTVLRPADWAAPCDCRAAPGARCTDATMTELKTVQLERAHGILVDVPNNNGGRFMGFDPITGGMVLDFSDALVIRPRPFRINVLLDAERALRNVVQISGQPSTCAPPGSKVRVPVC
jgi:prepilin-type N-terminal cleavage/methylation domain-containing protein